MNHYVKLLHFEIARFIKLYAVLGLLTLLSQVTGIWLYVQDFMSNLNRVREERPITLTEYGVKYDKSSFEYLYTSPFFYIPIIVCITALLLYVFFIWYRDWLGRNTFAFRLLTLPSHRMNVYYAKLTAILLLVLGLVAFQLLILPLELSLFNTLIPAEVRWPMTVYKLLSTNGPLLMLVPQYAAEFLIYYSAGLLLIIVLFTVILLERSYRLKGIFAAIGYVAVMGLLLGSPLILSEGIIENYFYFEEVLWMIAGATVLAGILSLWLSTHLMKKKISV